MAASPPATAAESIPSVQGTWEAFSECREAGSLSPVEALLLRSPPCSVEELLDEESVVQEFRCGNTRLLERLCKPESLRVLLQYVTEEPPEGLHETTRRRRPYAASELWASGSERLCDALLLPDTELEEMQAKFWAFLDAPGVGLTAPALAGYFCSTAVSLFSVRPAEVADSLRKHQTEKLLQSLLGVLELRCFAELLALLLAPDNPAHAVLPSRGLVRQLVNHIETMPTASSASDHATFLFEHLIGKACAGELSDSMDFLQQLADRELVAELVEKAIQGSGDAAAALSSGLSCLHQLSLHPLLPVRCNGLRNMQSWQAQGLALHADHLDREAVVDQRHLPGLDRNTSSTSSLVGSAQGGVPQARVVAEAFVREVCSNLPRLAAALEVAISARQKAADAAQQELATAEAARAAIILVLRSSRAGAGDETAGAGSRSSTEAAASLSAALLELCRRPGAQAVEEIIERCSAALGPGATLQAALQATQAVDELILELRAVVRASRSAEGPRAAISGGVDAEILSLLALLARAGGETAADAMLSAQVLPRGLELLLVSGGSSLLHNAARALFAELAASGAHGERLALSLLEEATPLLRRAVAVLSGVGLSSTQAAAGLTVAPLRCVCADLARLAGGCPALAAALAQLEGWTETVLPGIEAAERLCTEPLGGVHPAEGGLSSFNCYAAMRGVLEEHSEDVELSLEDLRDINEDLDVQQMLHRAEQQIRDRADLALRRRSCEEVCESASRLDEAETRTEGS